MCNLIFRTAFVFIIFILMKIHVMDMVNDISLS